LEGWTQEYDNKTAFAEGEIFLPFYRAQARERAEEHAHRYLNAAQDAALRIVNDALKRASANLSVTVGELQVPVPSATLKKRAALELEKTRAALRKELDRFADDHYFESTLDDLNATVHSALTAKVAENTKVIAARVDVSLQNCSTFNCVQEHVLRVLGSSPETDRGDALPEATAIAFDLAQRRPVLWVSLYMYEIIGTAFAMLLGCCLLRHCWASASNHAASA
jgi:hypothetical protein